jgi:hypothetical protein
VRVRLIRRTAGTAAAVLASTALLVAAPTGAAAAPDVSAQGSEVDLIATVGSDNALWTRVSNGGGWESLGGRLTSAPSMAYDGEDILFVGRGGDANVWIRSDVAGWRAFGPPGTNCEGPTISVSGDTVAVACRGGDGAVWVAKTRSYSGPLPAFSGWQRIGGTVKHGVTVSDFNQDGTTPRFAYTATGGDDALWLLAEGHSWERLGGRCTAAAAESEFADVSACRGGDGAVWAYVEGFARLGGNILGKPAVTLYSDDTVGAYAVGTDSRVWEWAGGQSWRSLGGSARHGVAALTFYGTSS